MDGGAWWLQSMGSQRVRHNSATNTFFTFTLAVAVGLRLPNICLFFFFFKILCPHWDLIIATVSSLGGEVGKEITGCFFSSCYYQVQEQSFH